MSIEVVIGLPGSGKTHYVAETVNRLRGSGDNVSLFLCSEAAELQRQESISKYNMIAARTGAKSYIDHFVSTEEALGILSQVKSEPSTTFVFDEAQYFKDEILKYWMSLSLKGHKIIISTPSQRQIDVLVAFGAQVTKMTLGCNLMCDGEADQFFLLPEGNNTLAVCKSCGSVLQSHAANTISRMLVENEPYPGEDRCYQPVEVDLPEFKRLKPIREDSATRAEIMSEYIKKHIGTFEPYTKTYLDVGCNIGYFCNRMAGLRFKASGVDIVERDIKVGRLLDAYFYKRFTNLIVKDAVSFLLNDTQEYDVTSTFSVFQWLYIQKEKSLVDNALGVLFKKTKSLLFFEMGYQKESHYESALAEPINRDWCYDKLAQSGLFKDIILIEEGSNGLKRDLFVAVR